MKTIGKVDKADFPEFGLSNISIKIDTGAFTSSIHCHHIKEILTNGEKQLEFELLDPSHTKYNGKKFKSECFKKKKIKNSFGKSENRFIVKTVIVVFGEEYNIDLSLSDRGEMGYPILLGRKLLNKQFIVDPSKKNLSYRLKQIKKKGQNKY